MVLTVAINGKWPNRMGPNSSIFEDIRNSSGQSPQLMKWSVFERAMRNILTFPRPITLPKPNSNHNPQGLH